MVDAIAEIRKSGRCPKNFQTNMGKKFYNADVKKIFKKHDVDHYSICSTLKESVVEQFNRMLKNDMWKMFTFNDNYKWVDKLSHLLPDYNACASAYDVTPAIDERLLDTVYSAIKIVSTTKFKVDDSVRVSKFKTGYTPNWTTDVYDR